LGPQSFSNRRSQKQPNAKPGSANTKLVVYDRRLLDGIVMEVEVDISRVPSVGTDEILVAGRSFVLGVARQHALKTDADALDVVDGAPALRVQ
jgi:hypothetical protein